MELIASRYRAHVPDIYNNSLAGTGDKEITPLHVIAVNALTFSGPTNSIGIRCIRNVSDSPRAHARVPFYFADSPRPIPGPSFSNGNAEAAMALALQAIYMEK